jgi:hypothetical protein
MTSLNQTILALQTTVTTNQNYNALQFTYIYGNLSSLQSQINALQVLITNLQNSGIITNANLQSLNATVQSWIATFQAQFVTLQNSLNSLTSTVSAQAALIATLNQTLLATQAQVNTLLPLLTSVAILQLNVTSLSNAINSITASITAIQLVDATQTSNIAANLVSINALQAGQTVQNQQITNILTNITTIEAGQGAQNAQITAIQLLDAGFTLSIAALQPSIAVCPASCVAQLTSVNNSLFAYESATNSQISAIQTLDTGYTSTLATHTSQISAIQTLDTGYTASILALQPSTATCPTSCNTQITNVNNSLLAYEVTAANEFVNFRTLQTSNNTYGSWYTTATQTPAIGAAIGYEGVNSNTPTITRSATTLSVFTVHVYGAYEIWYNIWNVETTGSAVLYEVRRNGVSIPGSQLSSHDSSSYTAAMIIVILNAGDQIIVTVAGASPTIAASQAGAISSSINFVYQY